ncbi:MAG: type 1 glutamine amidotransferase [Phycisphaeraceae bacterium]
MDLGDPLPEPDSLGGLVVMGGPMGVSDVQAHPHLAREQGLIGEVIARGLPLLGVCLGAQLVASALGAAVRRSSREEVGLGTVHLTRAGRDDPVLGGGAVELPVLHWHRDVFELPEGATLLASSEACRQQAFRAGAWTYGLQFHVELDRALVRLLNPHLPPDVTIGARGRARVERAGRRVIDRFFARSR